MFLSLAFHNHQPVGQLPWAFEDAWRDSYRRFYRFWSSIPRSKSGCITPGPYSTGCKSIGHKQLSMIQRLVAQGQVEILGGGLYEPILAIWPESRSTSTNPCLKRRVAKLFGAPPRGRGWPSVCGSRNWRQ